jgi:hypothetical protein
MSQASRTAAAIQSPKREILPPNYHVWLEGNTTKDQDWKVRFSEWKRQIKCFSALAEIHIVKNKDINWLDLRQHRAGLFGLLAEGENLLLELVALIQEKIFQQDAGRSLVDELDSLQGALFTTLNQWHGAIEHQADLPAELIQGFKDIDEGRVVDLDEALTDAPRQI